MSKLSYPSTFPPVIRDLLDRLHAASTAQEATFNADTFTLARKTSTLANPTAIKAVDDSMRENFVAIDNDRALFIYNLILASGATRIAEVGTSVGVSTIYLALAAIENARTRGSVAHVVATEKEASKAEAARANWKVAGVSDAMELRVGDLQETLKGETGDIEFVLLDIWPYLALPALNLLLPKLKNGTVVVVDNIVQAAEGYSDLLKVLRDSRGSFQSVTLPYNGGIEFSVYKA